MKLRSFKLLLVLSLLITQAWSQPYGNEWIRYNQQYFTINIVERGIYRIDYNTMLNAGVPLGTFDPRSFQIFAQGIEQPIFVRNEGRGIFLPGDYIEFYADRNTGWFDAGLYSAPEDQPNPNYSLINDTLTYFLTWNNLLSNRRITVTHDNNFVGFTPAPFFWYTSRQDFISHYYPGETNSYGVTSPDYTRAEGWFDAPLVLGQSRTHSISTPNIFTAGPQASIELAIAGASNFRPRIPDHHLQIHFAGNQIDTLFEGYSMIRVRRNVAPFQLSPTGTPFTFSSLNTLGSTVSRSAVAYISVRYPHLFQMRNQNNIFFELPPSPGERTLIAFTDFNAPTGDTVWVYNLTNHTRSRAFLSAATYRVLVPGAAQSRQIFITTSGQTRNINNIRPVSTNPQRFARFTDFLAAEHFNSDYIMITHPTLWREAENFRNFRNTTGYKVLLADVEELYHQFGFGIRKHPLAIKNFVRFTLSRFDVNPQKLFLIGRTRPASAYRRNIQAYATSMVPSFGDPPSDALLTSGLDGRGYAPALATGRLAARTPAEVALYLDKVIQHHNAQQNPQEWMKNILHFGGGSSISEQNILASYLDQYRRIVQEPYMGAHVRTFLKSSTDPIQLNLSDSLKRIINDGVNIMTFFGHAAGIGFDISIDHPAEYNNYGRYPFLVANSCFAGDIFGSAISSSEAFVLIEDKGTIGYLASTSAAGASELNIFSNEFFRQISYVNYGMPVGYAIREATRNVQSPNIYIRNLLLLNTLHGDPAVVLNAQPKPEYTITSNDIFFTPQDITTELDSFTVNVVITNIGRAIRDSMFIDLERRFSDNSIQAFQKRVASTLFKDTIPFTIPIERRTGIGLNKFTATIDALNQIEEISEINNSATTDLLIKTSDIIPVFPPTYSIVPNRDVTLMASTGDPFIGERSYVFQIDTSASFTNPVQQIIQHKGGVIKWVPPISLVDSTVYFWRASPEPADEGNFNWRSSSFQFIEGTKGWSQAHFDQFAGNEYRFISYNRQGRKWEFVNTINSIHAQTGVHPFIPWAEQYIRKDGVALEVFSCLADVGNGMVFAVFDPVSADHWVSINQGNNLGQYNNFHCRARPNNTFDFYSTSAEWLQRMEDFIDTIPEGHYVLVASHRNHNARNFPESLYQAFETLGSANIRNIQNNTPYLLFGQKGNPIGASNEVSGGSITSIIQLNDSITTKWNRGHILSEVIGPASRWDTIHWRYVNYDLPDTDSVWLNIIGIRGNGAKDTLIFRIPSHTRTISLSDYNIDAQQHPFLQLHVKMGDDINRTPAQMKYWKAIFEGIPETALDPSQHFVLLRDTVQEGENLIFSTAIHNIGNYDMDSLLVSYNVIDQNRVMHPVSYPRQGRHIVGDILKDTIVIPTKGLAGRNSLIIEVNPNNDQPEQNRFNNVGQVAFYVERDKINPLLEVTFDGVQIMDGDIVSSEPNIRISLRDENPFLELNDTSHVKVFITTPINPNPQRLFFNQGGIENMRFYPASLPDNKSLIEFSPVLESDGEYTLRVQATDVSLNESGDNDYVISFQVINRSTITEMLNWPNPFSTSTHFVFTLTGSQLPTFMKIQILTVTGKVVREIDMSELGPIRIGRNITTFAWDGTDRYGDRLANGVYLYRVITNLNGNPIEIQQSSASRYFHKGFGKMYLIR